MIYNIQEIRNLLSKDVNEETDYNKNDDDENNVIVPSDELPLTSVAIPSVEKSLLDKLAAKRSNAKVINTRYYDQQNFMYHFNFFFINHCYIRAILTL